jgi:hypothetical protein
VAIMQVFVFPPKESRNNLVSLLSLFKQTGKKSCYVPVKLDVAKKLISRNNGILKYRLIMSHL